MILGTYKIEELKKFRINRDTEAYGDISGLMSFNNDQDEAILSVRLFNDCEVEWVKTRPRI